MSEIENPEDYTDECVHEVDDVCKFEETGAIEEATIEVNEEVEVVDSDDGDILRKSFAEIARKPSYDGRIELVLGPMYSGKSTELLRRVRKFAAAGMDCVIVKYAKDTRYSNDFATHDKQTHRAIACNGELNDVRDQCIDCDIIGVDEGQFFTDLVDFCEYMANHRKIVIVSALDGSFARENFGQVHKLLPKCEFIEKIRAICRCGNDASFTHALTEMTEGEISIGGVGQYASMCRRCYHEETVGIEKEEEPIAFETVGASSIKYYYDPRFTDPIRAAIPK